MDAYLGTIMPWPVRFAPKDWALCDGTLLQIRNNTALYSIIGTRFGGDGTQTFALPNLTGRMPMGASNPNDAGNIFGDKTATFIAKLTLTEDNLPPHTHPATVSMDDLAPSTRISASTSITGGALVASENAVLTGTAGGVARAAAIYLPATVTPTAPVTLGGVTTTIAGAVVTVGKQRPDTPPVEPITFQVTVDTLPPYLTTNYIICVSGQFPPFG